MRRGIFFVVEIVVLNVICIVVDWGMLWVEVMIKGFGFGRDVVLWVIF